MKHPPSSTISCITLSVAHALCIKRTWSSAKWNKIKNIIIQSSRRGKKQRPGTLHDTFKNEGDTVDGWICAEMPHHLARNTQLLGKWAMKIRSIDFGLKHAGSKSGGSQVGNFDWEFLDWEWEIEEQTEGVYDQEDPKPSMQKSNGFSNASWKKTFKEAKLHTSFSRQL